MKRTVLFLAIMTIVIARAQETTNKKEAANSKKAKTSKANKQSSAANKGNLDYVLVQGGTFMMGCPANQSGCEGDESPAHQVSVSSYKISKTEVTVAQFVQFVDATGYAATGNWKEWCSGVDAHQCNMPVANVSWHDAVAFCTWAGGRLPTEAEWEYASSGGNKSSKQQFSGSNNIDDVAWIKDNSNGVAHNTASKKPNELGIYDMSGNVWEWCSDWYSDTYYAQSETNNPVGAAAGTNRARRGGGWSNSAGSCRSINRLSNLPDDRYNYLGFRVVVPQ